MNNLKSKLLKALMRVSLGALGAFVAFLGLVLQHGALCRGERHLGHREVAVDEGQNEGGDKGDGYVHREFLEPPRFGTLG